ncbi:MAG: ribbon-helix-helix protein, CopG family [Deltaproteobacteria bacterium]|nr:ribbon-helix-helix protein, CopG family [Deltaproteobacteria bacterium]
MSQQNVSITLDAELLKRLDALSEETERNRSWMIRQAVQVYLDELEDLKIARQRLQDKRLTPSQLRKAIGV